MKIYYYKLAFLFCISLLFSCSNRNHENAHSINWYFTNTEPMKNAWLNTDTTFFQNYIRELEREADKNVFYSKLCDFYFLSGRVIIAFDDSCQGEKHHIYNDLIIDSGNEVMNKFNAINGLKTYMKSKLLFRCNLNSDTLERILNINWKKCELMIDNDFDIILDQYNNYATGLSKCDTCSFEFMDSIINYHRCY
jgi:hypothetical protein